MAKAEHDNSNATCTGSFFGYAGKHHRQNSRLAAYLAARAGKEASYRFHFEG